MRIFQPYFCGQDPECIVVGSREALAKAKRNIELWYPVVGILEDLKTTLMVLEKKLPKYFSGVSELYYKDLKGKIFILRMCSQVLY